MIVLDTSALLRFFTNDLPTKAQEVKSILEGKEKILVPNVVFPELEYVLLGQTYQANRQKIIEAFNYLRAKKNVKLTPTMQKAIDLYQKSKLDISDCAIAASALTQKAHLKSYDQELLATYNST